MHAHDGKGRGTPRLKETAARERSRHKRSRRTRSINAHATDSDSTLTDDSTSQQRHRLLETVTDPFEIESAVSPTLHRDRELPCVHFFAFREYRERCPLTHPS